ncbi:cytochrome P450 [Nonomuraea sp. NN258]|uniref:cytochrome P450 n=1 Tax=Nonomuraea antri TaxID=2730852 RepID=UPI0015691E1A|nr:cytochrome P450 [Nonomuraea antri]NRQ40680.1 cytochrome P450 [Nonomuraea antri]
MPRGLPKATALENLRLAPVLLRQGAPHPPARPDPLRARSLLSDLTLRYGGRPVLARGPGGPVLLVLSGRDAARVLSGEAGSYAPAAREHPGGLPAESLRETFTAVAREEAAALAGDPPADGSPADGSPADGSPADGSPADGSPADGSPVDGPLVDGGRLEACWQRVARRCVYGAGAAEDEELSRLLARLARGGRWRARGRAQRRREVLSGRYDTRIIDHLRRAEPGSLAGLIAADPGGPHTRELRQAAFWLMGFHLIGPALMQTLALLATHPNQRKAARADAAHLRACLREGLRLWPPVPVLSRVTTADSDWYGTTLPSGTRVLVPLPAHQRDPRLPYADRFVPEIWLDGTAADEWWARPRCDGVELVIAVGTAFLGGLLRTARPKAAGRRLSPHGPLPPALDVARLRVTLRPRRRRR